GAPALAIAVCDNRRPGEAPGALGVAVRVEPGAPAAPPLPPLPSQDVLSRLGELGPVAPLAGLAGALPPPAHAIAFGRWVALRAAAHDGVPQGVFVSSQQYGQTLAERLRLEGQACAACGRVVFPKRLSCPSCGGDLTSRALSRQATVYAVTSIGRGSAPSEFAEQQAVTGAYDVAVVEFPEGPRVAAQLTDVEPGTTRIGARVALETRLLYTQLGEPRYGFKAIPVRAPDS
ncbi:MAG TPA: OB-fold domain-containing protein, partial [Candidatus Thermoplasmatota archaeon]|nr:OB-fold domain-containing protein [Candidatus Thermoplasmatota archaeon]